MRIVFWLLWALGTLAVIFGWLLAQAPGRTHTFDLSIWFCALTFLMVTFLILVWKKRANTAPGLLVFIGAELLWCGYGLWSFV